MLLLEPIKLKERHIKFVINLANQKKNEIEKIPVTWKGQKIIPARQKKGPLNHYPSTKFHKYGQICP
jgi:hypothetical protein